MRARCPNCSTGYQLRDGAVRPGQRMRFQCKKCGAQVVVVGGAHHPRRTSATRRLVSGETGKFDPLPLDSFEEEEPPPIRRTQDYSEAATPQATRAIDQDHEAPAPPPIPDERPTPEHLKPPLPKSQPPPDYDAGPEDWPALRAYVAIVVALLVGACAGLIGATFLLDGRDCDCEGQVEEAVSAQRSRAASAPIVAASASAAVAAPPVEPAKPSEPARPAIPANTAAQEHADAASAAPADTTNAAAFDAGATGAEHTGPPDTAAPAVAAAAAGPDETDGPDEAPPADSHAEPVPDPPPPPPPPAAKPVSKRAAKKPRKRERRGKRSWKDRAKAVLKRCDEYHRSVYEQKKAIKWAKTIGHTSVAEKTRALHKYMQGAGGVRMDEAMRDARVLREEAEESASPSDRQWFKRQYGVTCEKTGRYPPNP